MVWETNLYKGLFGESDMKKHIRISILNKKVLVLAVIACIFIGIAMPVSADGITFTKEETEYLSQGKVLKAASIDGGAPLHYLDSKGNIKGIAVNVLREISDMTGLVFEYHLYKSINEVLSSEPDVVFGLTKEYAPPGLVLSVPYLESETVLFFNKTLDPNELKNKRYASIQGGTLPEGIKEEHTIYYDNREDTINAVDSGEADYGYGNAYSVAFYTLQNGYKNIINIPVGKEERAYCLGIHENEEILLSIINKSIDSISKKRMDALILDVASQVERKLTFTMIIDAYGSEILIIVFIIMVALIYSALLNKRAKNRFEMENKRYVILSQLSNECLFEYHIKSGDLEILKNIDKGTDICEKEEFIEMLKNTIKDFDNCNSEENIYTLKMSLSGGDKAVFKVFFSYLKDESGKNHSIIGKLMDISEEEREKEQLITKSQLDGLTGLYNATTTKEAIIIGMKNKGADKTDAFIIIDCDKFKEINDNYGHLKGDLALQSISKGLKLAFRQTDIMGRIGGDEFCVYMHDIPSAEFVRLKCKQLINHIQELNGDFSINLSIGITIWKDQISYEDLFQQADDALYLAKEDKASKIIIYGEKKA